MIVYKVVLNLEPLAEMQKYDHSNKQYSALLFRGTVYKAAENCSNFENCGWNTQSESYCAVTSCGTVYYVLQGVSNF